MTKDGPMRRTATLLAPAVLLLGGCTQGGLDPRGDEAGRIFGIFWALTIAGGIVSLLVLALWAWGTVRGGPKNGEDQRAEHVPDGPLQRRLVVGGGIVMPAVVLAAFFGVQIASTMAQPRGQGTLTVEVTGHQYWWELEYRGVDDVDRFETANQLHVPVDTPVTLSMRSEDVIHSFWVPQLAGKVDLVPGRRNQMVLEADEAGTYRGYCAEFCGLQHARMKFTVVAMEPAAFRDWAETQAAPAPEPTSELATRGREVFTGQSCVGCHAIRGVAEEGEVGPDLTHLASRSQIAAGTLPLTREDLRAWIVNAQAIKAGAQMPPQELTSEELDALVAYLLELE